MQAGEVQGEIDRQLLTSDDKWILLRLDQAISEIGEALRDYKFTASKSYWNNSPTWLAPSLPCRSALKPYP